MRKRPIVRYHGSKFRIAHWIISFFPEHKVYVEPFGGGAGVLLKKERSYAEVYNDLDSEIVNLFLTARDHGEKLRKFLKLTPFSREIYFNAYKPFESSKNNVEKAAKTIVKSIMGFGSDSIRQKSGFRSDSNRSYTTPAHDWKNYPEALKVITERLSGVIIENLPAIDLIKKFDRPETLFYVDPPYVHSTRQKSKSYAFEMTDEQHIELAKCLKKCKGKVILSAYESELYNKLYSKWNKITKPCLADGARPRLEVIWKNF